MYQRSLFNVRTNGLGRVCFAPWPYYVVALDRDTILFHHGTGRGSGRDSACKNHTFTRQPQDVSGALRADGTSSLPAIRLIERPTLNAPKMISSYVQIHSISSPSRYVKDVLEIKSRKRSADTGTTAQRNGETRFILSRIAPKFTVRNREKVDFRRAGDEGI